MIGKGDGKAAGYWAPARGKGCGTVSRHQADVGQWLTLLALCCQVDRICHHFGETSVHIFERGSRKI